MFLEKFAKALFEEVLSLFLCLVTELNGVVGTMMVAVETGEAILMVKPHGLVSLSAVDVAHRADVGADAALDASFVCDMKTLVGDEYTFKESADDLRHKPWP